MPYIVSTKKNKLSSTGESESKNTVLEELAKLDDALEKHWGLTAATSLLNLTKGEEFRILAAIALYGFESDTHVGLSSTQICFSFNVANKWAKKAELLKTIDSLKDLASLDLVIAPPQPNVDSAPWRASARTLKAADLSVFDGSRFYLRAPLGRDMRSFATNPLQGKLSSNQITFLEMARKIQFDPVAHATISRYISEGGNLHVPQNIESIRDRVLQIFNKSAADEGSIPQGSASVAYQLATRKGNPDWRLLIALLRAYKIEFPGEQNSVS